MVVVKTRTFVNCDSRSTNQRIRVGVEHDFPSFTTNLTDKPSSNSPHSTNPALLRRCHTFPDSSLMFATINSRFFAAIAPSIRSVSSVAHAFSTLSSAAAIR